VSKKFVNRIPSGYDGGISGLFVRVTVLETKMETILPTLATKADLNKVEGILRSEIKEVEGRLRSEIRESHAKIIEKQGEHLKWLLVTAGGVLIGLCTLFFTSQGRMDRMDQRFDELQRLLIQSRPAPSPPAAPQ